MGPMLGSLHLSKEREEVLMVLEVELRVEFPNDTECLSLSKLLEAKQQYLQKDASFDGAAETDA